MLKTPLHPFTNAQIELVPESPGVYSLFQAQGLIYYGSSEHSIKDRLKSHKAGWEGPCTQNATQFQYELNALPTLRERELLLEFQRVNGRLPRCNSVIP